MFNTHLVNTFTHRKKAFKVFKNVLFRFYFRGKKPNLKICFIVHLFIDQLIGVFSIRAIFIFPTCFVPILQAMRFGLFIHFSSIQFTSSETFLFPVVALIKRFCFFILASCQIFIYFFLFLNQTTFDIKDNVCVYQTCNT